MKSTRSYPSSSALSRRNLLRFGVAGALGLAGWHSQLRSASAAQVSPKWLTIEKIERTTVEVPFRDIPARAMIKEVPHWTLFEVFEVTLKSGKTGFGETMLYYTWGVTEDDDVKRAQGQNAIELMWDDSIGAGLQISLFDAVAKSLEVPVHALLGHKIYERTPLSWWNIDTSPEDMALECAAAYKQGYMSYKTKGRPWIDLWKQFELSTAVVPPEFKIDMDFNDTLLDADRGIPILLELEKYPQTDIWEGPIPQKDLDGNRRITEACRAKTALHYGHPAPMSMLMLNACDGFVVGGGAQTLQRTAAVCETADKPFWLQLVGSDITAAWSLHFGGVCKKAQWPAVNCHQLYKTPLLTKPIVVKNGTAVVPDEPGLGFELDKDALAKLKITKPTARPEPERLIETTYKDGRRLYIANTGKTNFLLGRANAGEMPYFEKGVSTRVVPDDGTPKWRELYERAQQHPTWG